MTLVRLNQELMPSIFSNFFDNFLDSDLPDIPKLNWNTWSPAVNIKETKEEYILDMEIPGFNKKDFKINVEDALLIITGEHETKAEDKDEKYSRKEFGYNSFKRTFTLPDHVNGEKITAQYSDGILTLSLPKIEEAKTKSIKEIKIT